MPNQVIGKCPICGENLQVTRLECNHCGTELGGHFTLGRLSRLGAEDSAFVETFIKTRGNAYRVADEMDIPYSAVRARLTEIIRTLGFEPETDSKDEPGISPDKRKQVLDDLAVGKLTSDAAIRLLQGEQ